MVAENVVSEARRKWVDLQQISPEALNQMGSFPQGSLDRVVQTFLASTVGFSGLQASVFNTTKIAVAPGVVFSGGKGYALRDAATIDLALDMASTPEGQFKIVLIVGAPEESDDASAEPVTLLDASKKPVNPRDYWATTTSIQDTVMVRSVDVQKKVSLPSVQPDTPTMNETHALIATAIISNVAVVSLVMNEDQDIMPLAELREIVELLNAGFEVLGPQIATLLSSVSAIALQLADINSMKQVIALLTQRINELEQRLAAPSAVLRGADYFVDESQSTPGHSGYSALISEGLKFPAGSGPDDTETIDLAPTNPSASNIRVMGNKLMANFTEVIGLQSPSLGGALGLLGGLQYSPYSQLLALNTLGAFSATFKIRGFSRLRQLWAAQLSAQRISEQINVLVDPSDIFAQPGYTFDPGWGIWQRYNYELARKRGFWRSLASRGYWVEVVTSPVVSGVPTVMQPLAPSGVKQVTGIKLRGQRSGNQDLHVYLLQGTNGQPDETKTLVDITVPATDIPSVSAGEFTVPMPYPITIGGSDGMAFMGLSSAGHKIEFLRDVANAPRGALGGRPKQRVGNAWVDLNGVQEVRATLMVAEYEGVSTQVPLNPLQLPGGIDSVDIGMAAVIPDGNDVTFVATIAGVRIQIDEAVGAHPLAGRPSNVPLDLILQHTKSASPIIDLDELKAILSKAATALVHVSSTRSPSVPVDIIEEAIIISGWNGAKHTVTMDVLTGGGFASVDAFDAVQDEVLPDGKLRKSFSWAVTDVGAHKVRINGATTDPQETFVIEQATFAGRN